MSRCSVLLAVVTLLGMSTKTWEAFSSVAYSEWGNLNLPSGSVASLHQFGWSSERALDVTVGGSYTMGLFGRHESGNTTSDCTGSFTIQIFTGTLP